MALTRIRDLVGIVVVAAAAAWIVVRTVYGSLPPVPLLAGAFVFGVAAIEVAAGAVVRNRIRHRRVGSGRGDLHPITAARIVAVAKASALVGAAVFGVWLGFLLHIVPQRSTLTAAAADTAGALTGAVGALALAAAGVWLERCCRTPDDPDGDADPVP